MQDLGQSGTPAVHFWEIAGPARDPPRARRSALASPGQTGITPHPFANPDDRRSLSWIGGGGSQRPIL